MQEPARILVSMATAYRSSQLVYVAAKLGIADQLAEGPKGCEQIAEALAASPDVLCRVMRGLAMLGVFDMLDDGRFVLTELSQSLRTDVPGSARRAVIFHAQEQYRAWGELLHTVLTGAPAFQRIFGDPFDYNDQHPEAGEVYDEQMTDGSRRVAIDIMSSYEFPEQGTVVDVAGGEGYLLAAVLNNRPGLRGILLERSTVVDKARRMLDAEGLLARCRLEAGDCRRSVPEGGDVYILKNVIHDWDDADAVAILTAVGAAMKTGARLIVIQRVVPDVLNRDAYASSMIRADLRQLVHYGGRQRTLDQYRKLMEDAGLKMDQPVTTAGGLSIMEAHKASPSELAGKRRNRVP
jgi:hypothetical protein